MTSHPRQLDLSVLLSQSKEGLTRKVLEDLEGQGARWGYLHTDPITGKQRETDVTVHRNTRKSPAPSYVAVVECKHTSAGKAWVAIRGLDVTTRSRNDAQRWFAVPAPDSDHQEAIAVGTSEEFLSWDPPATRVITTDSKPNKKNAAADAARQAVNACLGYLSSLALFWPKDDPTVRGSLRFNIHFGIAVVITTAPLFTAYLDDTSQIQAQQVNRFEVLIDNGDGVMRPVLVMNEEALPEFVVAFNPTVTAL